MNSINSKFQFTENCLINFNNEHFPLIGYESQLHSDLAYCLQDPDLAKMIHSAYAKNLAKVMTNEEKTKFEKALLRVCFLFGSPKYPPHLGMKLALLEENFLFDTWIDENKNVYQQFMLEANQSLYPSQRKKSHEEKVHIVITTTSAAGGNYAVAMGLKTLLEKNYKITVIDVEKLSEKVDHIKIATGTHTTDRIYAEVIQQANQMQEGFDLQMNVGRKIAQYISPTLGKALKQQILDLDADFILSTRNGHQLDISLSPSLEIPGCIIHCDSEVGYFHKDFIGKIQHQLLKIWLPSDHPRVFSPVLARIEKPYEKFQDLSWCDFKGTLSDALRISVEELESQMVFVGAPTDPEIKKIKNPELLDKLRYKWDLLPDQEGVIISLGKNGVGHMQAIFDELLHSPAHSTPIKYYFVCGTNEKMKSYFEEQLKNNDLQKSALKFCSVHGFLSSSMINELMNICILGHGKPGGSQKEEFLKVGLPMMIIFSHLWETCNQAELERAGYALTYDSQKSIATQTEQHVNELKINKLPQIPRKKWKKLIPLAIKEAFIINNK